MDSRNKEQNKKKFHFPTRVFTKRIITIIVIFAILAIGIMGIKKYVSFDSKTTKLGFENIGELATQSAFCTEVHVTEASRELLGIEIPFTQSKYVYSYDVVIKAGFDFKEIEWSVNNTTITIKLPEVKLLSNEIKTDSFKVYHEEESIFRRITLTENNEAINSLKQRAEEDAIANGLFEEARSNAKTILTGFFANVYDLEQYELTFTDK